MQCELAPVCVGRPARCVGCGQAVDAVDCSGRQCRVVKLRQRVSQITRAGGLGCGASPVGASGCVTREFSGCGCWAVTCSIAVSIRDQQIRVILTAVKKHADNGFVVGADLSGINATGGVGYVVKRTERRYCTSDRRAADGLQKIAAIFKGFEVHDQAAYR